MWSKNGRTGIFFIQLILNSCKANHSGSRFPPLSTSPVPSFLCLSLRPLKRRARIFLCKERVLWLFHDLSFSLSLTLHLVIFKERWEGWWVWGGGWLEGNHVSSSSRINWDGAWHLLLHERSSEYHCCLWLTAARYLVEGFLFWSCVGRVQGTKSLHATKISLTPSLRREMK